MEFEDSQVGCEKPGDEVVRRTFRRVFSGADNPRETLNKCHLVIPVRDDLLKTPFIQRFPRFPALLKGSVKATNPKILFISSSWPFGRTFGGQIRALNTARALQGFGAVSVLVVADDSNEFVAGRRETQNEFVVIEPIQPLLMPHRSVWQKARRVLDSHFLNVHGVVASELDGGRVQRLIAEYDLVWVLNSRTPNILQIWDWPHSHLDIDDVPSTYLRALARSAGQLRARWKARFERFFMHRRELLLKTRFTTLSVCSEADRRYLRGGAETHVLPNGFAKPATTPVRNRAVSPPCIGFIGLYTYPPNQEGVHWFLKECWPLIRKEVPGIRFRLVGAGTEAADLSHHRDVDGLGWIAEPTGEISTWSAMVIPIRVGGGTRIKIADSYSRKCPVVSTSLGAFGYEAVDGRQLRLADQPEEFAAACVELVRRPERGEAMAERAWEEFLEKWTWDAIAPRVVAAAENCLRRSRDN